MNKNKISLQKRQKKFTLDGAHRIVSPKETLKKIKSNSAINEIIKKCKFIKDDKFNIFSYIIKYYMPGEPALGESMGKGFIQSQAYCSGIMEAIERHCCTLLENDRLIFGNYKHFKGNAINPEILGVFRKGPYSPDLWIDWIWAWNLTKKKDILVPVLFGLYISSHFKHSYYFSNTKKTQYTLSDSNGCAAGNCIEEAILHGILEIVERDAVFINARNNLRPPDIDVTNGIKNKYLIEFLDKIFIAKDIVFKIKYLTLDINIPTFACVLLDNSDGLQSLAIGYGTHFDPEIALIRSISELFQARAINQISKKRNYNFNLFFPRMDYLLVEGRETISFKNINNLSSEDICEDLNIAIKMLEKENMDVIVINRTKKGIGFPAVKVVIPNAQRADWVNRVDKNLLGMGSSRIFNVPQKLGLRRRISTLSELDPSQITYY